MQRFAFSTCRTSLFRTRFPDKWFTETQYLTRRFRSSDQAYDNRKGKFAAEGGQRRGWSPRGGGGDGKQWGKKAPPPVVKEEVAVEDVPAALQSRVTRWAASNALAAQRLETFGIPPRHVPVLMNAFAKALTGGLLTRPGIANSYNLDRFTSLDRHADACLTNVFYSWASDPDHRSALEALVSPSTIQSIVQLREAADLSYPAEAYPEARSIRRKFYMHVGPTNSGKTHNALRALAAASTGVYAGPLRLLAHEVWERLNKGDIVPLGMDPVADVEPNMVSSLDAVVTQDSNRRTVQKQGTSKFARECNLVTGEEEKYVSEDAGLWSCTIEMLSMKRLLDVAVVDEIQMIADQDRGSAWTAAVLGLHAKEIHLCGEETAIPVIEALLKETGDELIINRYERLTPLVIEEKSLEGDLSRVQKGDCIVTFSRSGIFALKRQVEEQTGMRCAVAYGRLPPEIRSEQAALFNDPDSGYDVIIGSDAIGMGLNLKIKRIVFEAVRKFNGYEQVQLSTSQLKQIAGRAGRYGLHTEAGGSTTTLFPNDLPILRKALDQSIPPLTNAFLNHTPEQSQGVAQLLPPDSPMIALHEVYTHIAKMRWPYHMQHLSQAEFVCEFVDTKLGALPLSDRIMMLLAPVPWRDESILNSIAHFCHQHRDKMQVNLVECLRSGPLDHLEDVELSMSNGPPRSTHETLSMLEGLHKLVVFYMWMQMRSPVVWCNHTEAVDLKERTERALDWCLQGVSWGKRTQRLPDITALREKKEDDRITFVGRKALTALNQNKWDSYRAATVPRTT